MTRAHLYHGKVKPADFDPGRGFLLQQVEPPNGRDGSGTAEDRPRIDAARAARSREARLAREKRYGDFMNPATTTSGDVTASGAARFEAFEEN